MKLLSLRSMAFVALVTLVACGESPDILDSAEFVRIGDGVGRERVDAATVGPDGATYVFGSIGEAFDGPGTVLGQSYTAIHGGLFLAKLSATGDVMWLRVIETDVYEVVGKPFGTGIAVDADGHVLVTGMIRTNLDLGDGAPTVPDGVDDKLELFAAKYDTSDGGIVWSRRFWGSDDRYSWPGPPKVDPDGNVVFAVYEHYNSDFGDGALEPYETVLVKLDANGELVYARGIGQPIDGRAERVLVTAFTPTAAREVAFMALVEGIVDLGDGFTVGADNSLSELLVRVGPTGEITDARSIARDPDVGRAFGMAVADGGDFIVGGYRYDPEDGYLSEGFVERIASDGTRRWRAGVDTQFWSWPERPLSYDGIGAFAVDGRGRPIVMTEQGVTSFDLDGQRRWHYQFSEGGTSFRRVAARGDSVVMYGSTSWPFTFAGQRFELDGVEFIREDGFVMRFSSE